MLNDNIIKLKEKDEKRFKLFKVGEIFDSWSKYFFEDRHVLNRKGVGAFYTPEWIVKIMVERALRKLLDKNCDLAKIKILEPSAGTGNFVDILIEEIHQMTHRSYQSIADQIYLIDINLDSLKLLIKRMKEKYNVEMKNIFHEDALEHQGTGYDLIIGNPPYGNLLSKEYKKEHGDRYNNIALSFLAKFQKSLSDDGILYFIVPHSFSRSGLGSEIWRNEIKKEKSLYEVIDVGNPFYDITLEQIIVGLNKKNNLLINSGSIRKNKPIEEINIDDFYSKEDSRMIIYFDEYYRNIMNKFTLFPFYGKRGKDYKKDELEQEKNETNYFLVGGKNISKNGIIYLKNYDKFVSDKTHVLEREVVGITQFGTNLKAAIIKKGMIPSGGIVLIKSKHLNNDEIVAFLNRKDVEEFLRKYIFNYAELTVHIDAKYIKQIPYFI